MKRGVILDEQALRKEIEESHRRSNEYGINTEERDPGQVRLSPGELELWRLHKRDFLEVARTHIDEFYDLISPRDFMIAVVDDDDREVRGLADHVITIPAAPSLLAPVVATIPLQLLAYHIADLRGTDVDQPRNLAKSVTVE